MAFVKLDCAMIDSSIWDDRDQRDIFITALLKAEPHELLEPTPQLQVRQLVPTGWIVPPGWYGFVRAAGTGLTRLALVEREAGLTALEQLGSPEDQTKTKEFEGRRVVRIDGGFIVLNFMKYRDKDYTAAERQKRFRERKKQKEAERRAKLRANGDIIRVEHRDDAQ